VDAHIGEGPAVCRGSWAAPGNSQRVPSRRPIASYKRGVLGALGSVASSASVWWWDCTGNKPRLPWRQFERASSQFELLLLEYRGYRLEETAEEQALCQRQLSQLIRIILFEFCDPISNAADGENAAERENETNSTGPSLGVDVYIFRTSRLLWRNDGNTCNSCMRYTDRFHNRLKALHL
jgi:hypothetical protein